jgi:hypothetical protein
MGELSQKLTPKEQRPVNSQAHEPCKLPQIVDIVYLESGLQQRSRPTEGESHPCLGGEALRSSDRWGHDVRQFSR